MKELWSLLQTMHLRCCNRSNTEVYMSIQLSKMKKWFEKMLDKELRRWLIGKMLAT